MLKKVLIGLAVLLVVLVAVIATRPETTHVERSTRVSAPADVAYAVLLDLGRFEEWSPWQELDPSLKSTVTGPPGKGQRYEWQGNDQVGSGAMTTVEVVPDRRVAQDLHFKEPFESRAAVALTVKPEGDESVVTWAMDSQNDFMGKAFGMFMDMEAMIGADFEKGLGKLKPLIEAEAKKRAEAKAAEVAAAEAEASAPPPPPAEGEAAAPTPAQPSK